MCRDKSGRELPVIFSASRIAAGAAGAPALILVGVNYAEQKQAMEQIAYLRNLNDSIVASISDGIIVIDCTQKILAVNEVAADRYGWDDEEVVGRRLSDLLPHLRDAGIEDTLRRTFQGDDKTVLIGVKLESREGTLITENLTSYPLRRGGNVQGAVIVTQDVTNQTQRERELELLFEISKALASTIDLRPLLERLVSVIREAFGFMYAAVYLVDNDNDELQLKSFSIDDPELEPAEHKTYRICVDGVIGWAAYAKEVLVIPDVSADARCVGNYEDVKSEMAIPLVREGRVVGVLDVGSRAGGAFPAGQRQMLEQLANQLAVAIVDAKLYEEAKMRVAELSALRGVALAISSLLDIDTLLDQFVDIMMRSFGYSYVAVLIADSAKNELSVRAQRGYAQSDVEDLRIKVRSEGITGWVAHSGQPLVVADVSRDPRFISCSSKIGSEVAVPLVEDSEVIGVLDVASADVGGLGEYDLRIMQQLASQIMIAFKNAKLYDSVASSMREFRALEEFNRSVLENIPSGIITIDEKGIVTSVNRTIEEALGKGDQDLVGQPVDEIVKLAPGSRCYLRDAVDEGKEVRRGEARIILEDGRRLHIGMSTSVLRGDDDQVTGAVGVITDLTNIKVMEEKMRRSDQLALLGQMSASMAHEIKNPLAGICTGVEYLMEGFDETDPRRDASQMVLQEIARLDRIVRDLTSFSHRPPLYLVPLDLREVAKRALCLLQQEIKEQNLDVETSYAPDLPQIMGDEVQVGQVFLNLLLNAIQAMPDGGSLEVDVHAEVRESRKFAVIEISDTGKGILPEHLSRVFDPFFSTKHGGTGLGLAVTQRIVEDHEGTIEVTSTPEEGTAFRVEFEVRQAAKTTEPEPEPEQMAVKDGVYDSNR
jgi:PAS domain S-box-containing protein